MRDKRVRQACAASVRGGAGVAERGLGGGAAPERALLSAGSQE